MWIWRNVKEYPDFWTDSPDQELILFNQYCTDIQSILIDVVLISFWSLEVLNFFLKDMIKYQIGIIIAFSMFFTTVISCNFLS